MNRGGSRSIEQNNLELRWIYFIKVFAIRDFFKFKMSMLINNNIEGIDFGPV